MLEVGQRVSHLKTRELGYIIRGNNRYSNEWLVEWDYGERDNATTDELGEVEVTVIEGTATVMDIGWFVNLVTNVGGKRLGDTIKNGEHYRITIEKLPKEV